MKRKEHPLGRQRAGVAGKRIRYNVIDNPTPEDVAAVDEGLEVFNQAATAWDGVRRLACLARLANQCVIGGAVARTWGACCELQQIWVDERYRRGGVGRRLVQHVETEARARGCTLLFLETFSFQAPTFYRRLGFETICEFNGFPEGISKYIMRKSLSSGPSRDFVHSGELYSGENGQELAAGSLA